MTQMTLMTPIVIKVELVKEVKRSDGVFFVCGEKTLNFLEFHPFFQMPTIWKIFGMKQGAALVRMSISPLKNVVYKSICIKQQVPIL